MDKEEVRIINEEIQALQRLDHPNLVKLLCAWMNESEEVVLIFNMVSGGSLKSYLKKTTKPYLVVIKRWCRGILEALDYLHSQLPLPIIHKRLQLESFFIRASSGECLLGDLGISILKTNGSSSIPMSPIYMAPEVFDELQSPKMDIYSLGISIIEMCT